MKPAEHLIGSGYQSLVGPKSVPAHHSWEIIFEGMLLVITENNEHLLGLDPVTRLVKWAYSAAQDQFITGIYVQDSQIWVSTFSCMHYELDFRTGQILNKEFLK